MAIYDSDAVAQATIAMMAQLIETLRQRKILSSEEITGILNVAIADSAHHPQRAEIAAVIHEMAGSK